MWICFTSAPYSMCAPHRNRWLQVGCSVRHYATTDCRFSEGSLMRAVSRRPALTLVVASVAAFMTSLDTMVVTTALPTLRSHLGGSVGQLEWTMNAYYLAFACLLITAAGLGDRYGRRRVLCAGLGAFGLASWGAALAPNLDSLIAARAVQGGAAAAVMPLTLTVISEAYPSETRGKAIGIWGALLGAGGVL